MQGRNFFGPVNGTEACRRLSTPSFHATLELGTVTLQTTHTHPVRMFGVGTTCLLQYSLTDVPGMEFGFPDDFD